MYYRIEGRTQTSDDALEQVRTLEIWGRGGHKGNVPSVKAYNGPIPVGTRGIEFDTSAASPEYSSPVESRWYYPQTKGVQLRVKDGDDYACIRADWIINHQTKE